MIDTVNTQAAHYSDGCFRVGSGEHVITILGSCRVLPYANYFNRLNTDNRFTICLINLVNFVFSESGNQVDPNVFTDQFEKKPVLLDMIKRSRWFIHEYAENFRFLNTSHEAEKNIYQHGMNAIVDISIPNFNDHLILANDWVDYGSITPNDYVKRGEKEIEKFCKICSLTDCPEMADHFRNNWRTTRFFYKPNHISAAFSLYIFRLMSDKFLHLDLSDEFWAGAATEDLYKQPCTAVTQKDREGYSITW